MNRIQSYVYTAFLTLILGLAFGSTQVFAADIVASVDRNPVNQDESFKIYFTANDTPDSDPDFTPLEQDFTIINQAQSTSSSWVNGTYSKTIRWTVEVTANKSGNLMVPAITFGNDASKPLPITVAQSTSGDTANTNAEIFLEAKASPENPFVQSQVLYTVRLYRRVDIAQAELNEPELADAVIEKLGEDSNFNTVVNGISYLVTERKYAVFPQKSGLLKIKPLTLTAQVIVPSQPDFRDFFGTRMSKTQRVMSNEVALDVKPKPSQFTGKDWLAVKKLELSQEWSGDTQQMKVGEPLTRTLTIRGEGTTVGQLPELSAFKTNANFKAYPDQPVLNEQKLPEGVAAVRQEKIAIIPATGGKITLPAIEIPWFNTQNQKMEIALLPETTLNVTGTLKNQPEPAPKSNTSTVTPVPGLQPQNNNPILVETKKEQPNFWPWLSLLLALGWVVTVIYFLKKRPKHQLIHDKTNRLNHEAGLKQSTKRLKEACNQNNAKEAKNALLEWGLQMFNISNIVTLSNLCDARLRDEILLLNQTLYGKSNGNWNGKKLLQAFTENNARAHVNLKEEPVLEPLHRL
jgi:hypothetical protein